MTDIDTKLSQNNEIVVVSGISGIGKSSIINAFLNLSEFCQKYDNVVAISIKDNFENTLIDEFSNLDIGFKYSSYIDRNSNLCKIKQLLISIPGNNLIVIDNINDLDCYYSTLKFFESFNWKVIISTQTAPLEIENIQINGLNDEESFELFGRTNELTYDKKTLCLLFNKINYHPLLIELFASALKTNLNLQPKDILLALEKGGINSPQFGVLISPGYHGRSHNMYGSYYLNDYIKNLITLNDLSEKEKYYLICFSLLANDYFSIKELYKLFQITKSNEVEFYNYINILQQKRFIEVSSQFIKIHFLIQNIVHSQLTICYEDVGNIIDFLIKFIVNDTALKILETASNILNIVKIKPSKRSTLLSKLRINSQVVEQYKKLIDLSHILSVTYRYKGDLKKSFYYSIKSLRLLSIIKGNYSGLISLYIQFANVLEDCGHNIYAQKYYVKAYKKKSVFRSEEHTSELQSH